MDIVDYRLSIGKKVRKERLKHDWTQEELAEKINLHPSFIGQIERGLKTAGFDTLKRLSSIFGIKLSEFMREGDDMEPAHKPYAIEHKILNLLKGCTLHDREAVYQTIKYILRQKRKLTK